MPGISSLEIQAVVLVDSLEDVVDRCVPRLTLGSIPLARHKASQPGFLKLGVKSSLSVLDLDEDDPKIVVRVEDSHHGTASDVYLTVLTIHVVTIVRQIPWMNVSRIYIFFNDPSGHTSLFVGYFFVLSLLRCSRNGNDLVGGKEVLKRCRGQLNQSLIPRTLSVCVSVDEVCELLFDVRHWRLFSD